MDLRALKFLKSAPALMFAFSYWAFSNPQIFNNNPPDYVFSNRAANPEHKYLDFSMI